MLHLHLDQKMLQKPLEHDQHIRVKHEKSDAQHQDLIPRIHDGPFINEKDGILRIE